MGFSMRFSKKITTVPGNRREGIRANTANSAADKGDEGGEFPGWRRWYSIGFPDN